MVQVEIIKANLKTEDEIVNNLKKRVCAYARVSTDSEEQQTSYNSQIKHYSKMIKSNSSWDFVGVYADEGISGTQVKNRVEFTKMIDDAINGKIDIIIAKSISRFARNTLDTLKYIRLLREKRVDVYFEKENIHTLELESEMFLTLFSAFAQAESESMSQNVKLGLRAKMKRGEYIGYAECYGFKWNKITKELEINEEEAKVVKMIFDLYVSGVGSFTISNMLNEKGIKAHRGGIWRPTSVRCVLRNEKYVGDLLNQKTYVDNPLTHKHVKNFGEKEKYYVKNHHPGIIDRSTWDKAQEIYSARSKCMIPDGNSHCSKYSLKYPFSSKIECGICGRNYVRRMNEKRKDGTRKTYWNCYNRSVNVKKCDKSIFISEYNLKTMFIEIYNFIVKKNHKTKDKLLKAIKDTLKEEDSTKKLNQLKLEKEKLEKRLSNLIDMKLDDFENKDAYLSKEKEINKKIGMLKNEIKEYESLKTLNNNIQKQISTIESVLNSPNTINEFDENIFNNLVEKIIVGEKCEDKSINSNVVRFILKIGTDYVYDINDDKSVSFRTNNLEKCSAR